jgi:methylenetetrahydrofolate reductase (NADPH)
LCEVADFECIWSRAYDRAKYEGNEQHMLDHAPVIQDQSLRGTSSWANAFLCRDHTATSDQIVRLRLQQKARAE